jgi:hypothetical protein
MKLIEPIKNLGSFATSDAPEDGLAVWAPIGRDLLRYLEKPVFDIVDDILVAASSTVSGPVYSVDLATGIVTELAHTTTAPVRNVELSQDKLLIAISDFGGIVDGKNGDRFKIILRSNGTTQYTKTIYENLHNLTLLKRTSQFVPDSSLCFFFCSSGFFILTISTYVATLISGDETGTGSLGGITMVIGSTHLFQLDQVVAGAQQINKISLTGSIVNSVDADSFADKLRYNPSLDEVFSINTNSFGARNINQTTLAQTVIASFPGVSFIGDYSIVTTSSFLILRSLSTSPYWNYYNLSDYSFNKSLPALTDPGEVIAVGTTYTVVQQDSGIETLLSADDSILTQTNPSVLVGDTFEYNLKIYEVLIDSTDQPNLGALETPATWLDKGAINRLRMFDGKLDNLTTSTTAIIVDITPNQISSGIALLNLDTKTIQVTMTDPTAGLVYDSGVISMLDNSGVKDWFTYFFSPYIKKADFVSLSLPPYPDAVIQVTVDGDGDAVSIGQIVMGRTFSIGDSQFGTGVGIIDFSEKEQDAFGNFEILERKFSKRADFDVKIPTQSVSGAQRTLSRFRATPVVWVGDESKEETIIYGYFKSFDIVISNPAFSDTSILVEGL